MADFETKFADFRAAYDDLFVLLDSYPADKREKSGACGWWSPKQILAHFSGWITEGLKRYGDYDSGDQSDLHYDDDSFNAQVVDARSALDWDATVAELRGLVRDFSTHAESIPADKRASDRRYTNWMIGLGNDCKEHTWQLKNFLNVESYPILEYDSTPEAIIEPVRYIKPIDIPQNCVLCFFQEVITEVCGDGKAKFVANRSSEMGTHPIYEIEFEGKRVAIMHPGVGAPLAGGFLDEIIALGCRKFIACGGAGVLNREIAVGHVVIPTSAVRDEGTSYHYLPPSREVSAHPDGVAAIEATLKKHHVSYIMGKTWTTDGLFRETRLKMERRKAEGCVTVEMEASAFFAVAQFRGVTFAQLLYGGDDISGDEWDHRDWRGTLSNREKLFWLAVEACAAL
jgi:uridine phosphorylase